MKKIVIITIITLFCTYIDAQKIWDGTWRDNFEIAGIKNFMFMTKLDSIVQSVSFNDTTPVLTYNDSTDDPNDYFHFIKKQNLPDDLKIPNDVLEKCKYYHVSFFAKETEDLDSQFKEPIFNDIDLNVDKEFIIGIYGYAATIMDDCYYTNYKKQHYFFDRIIPNLLYKTSRNREFVFRGNYLIACYSPFPVWIIKYNNGEMQLKQFYIEDKRDF